jgi:hypothetical protein
MTDSRNVYPGMWDERREPGSPELLDDRRGDERFALRGPCAYELIDHLGDEPSVLRGRALSLNVSSKGILLLLDSKARPHQLLEIRNPALKGRHAVTLFEIRWAQALPSWTTRERYLVGCHLTFGRAPYFLVQRIHLDQQVSGLYL